ncbi:hypothetical protein [Rhodococcus pyridinivorans]|uniref:Minor tail protein n=1 Tax=Rhodococcus pyridinivorans TaxID=103816 RepID=A0A7M2XNU6_9NOCA|nr:hypothetical protein [Rhodococcus pyridinivorans]QOV99494.1 hypothetical protein INP59_03570 [Rhodococcus pyridinivorans]
MTIEYQHVTGEWRITGYDSRDDVDALPEQLPLRGTVTFTAKFDKYDRFKTIYVPGVGGAPGHQLRVRDMKFPVVKGRLMDRQARDGVMLPAVVGGVPIIWTARPDLYEDPGTGALGAPVPADKVTWSPPPPEGDNGEPLEALLPGPDLLPGVDVFPTAGGGTPPPGEVTRRVDLGAIVDATIEYIEPVVSHVAYLVGEARDAEAGAYTSARDAEASATAAATSASDAATSAGGADTARQAAATSATQAADRATAAATSATNAATSATAAAGSATAADQSKQAAATSASNAATSAGAANTARDAAAGSAANAAGSATAAAGSATTSQQQADRARDEADRAQTAADSAVAGVPIGGWPYSDLAAPVRASLDKADTALQDVAVADVDGLLDQLDGKADLDTGGLVPRNQLPTHAHSVNGQTGDVDLDAADVGAAPASVVQDVTNLQTGKAPAHQIVASLPATGTPGVLYLVPKS